MIKTRQTQDTSPQQPVDLQEKMEICANLVEFLATAFASTMPARDVDSHVLTGFATELAVLLKCVKFYNVAAHARLPYTSGQPLVHIEIVIEPERHSQLIQMDVSFPLMP